MLIPQKLKESVLKKGYRWYSDRPNLIGIRTTLQVPDVFNDVFAAVWNQPTMPSNLTNDVLGTQKWLNSFLYVGENGLMLQEDGIFGKNTKFALDQYSKSVGLERMKTWTITTDPGVYWLNHPMNPGGTAIMKPGQYVNAYQLGIHIRQDHPALIQTGGQITVYRDNNLNNTYEIILGSEITGFFGVNIHRSNATGTTPAIGQWSAGCQVFPRKSDHDELLRLCRAYLTTTNNFYTYTLVEEKDLI